MRVTRTAAALVLLLTLIGSAVSGAMVANSRQGSDPVPGDSAPGPTPSVSAFTAGFLAWDTTTRVRYDDWGNLRWPDKPGHGIKPCDDKDLDDYLDRLDFGRSFGFDHDGFRFGRHFAGTLSPYLYASRRLDTFSRTYNNRNRQYSPQVGRFISKDPIGFRGGSNLWSYARQNPLRYTDPFGLFTFENVGENPIALLAINKIQNKAKAILNDPAKVKILLEAGWKDEAEIARDFLYGTPPSIKFETGIWPNFGYDNGAQGTKIAQELLDAELLKSNHETLAFVLGDVAIHEMSHWKARSNKDYNNPNQGWNFLRRLFGGQWNLRIFPPGSSCPERSDIEFSESSSTR